MSWQVHYQRSEQQFHAQAADRSTAIAIACILIRDGHDVIKLVSTAGETIETDEIIRLATGDASRSVVPRRGSSVILEALEGGLARPWPCTAPSGRHLKDPATEFDGVWAAARG